MQLDFAADLEGILLEVRVRSCVSGPVVPGMLALQMTRHVPLSGQVGRKRMMKTQFRLRSWKRVKKPVYGNSQYQHDSP